MTTQNEITRLKNLGHSKAEVSRLLNIDRATVKKYWEGPPTLEITPRDPPQWVQQIDWPYLDQELAKGVSKRIMYDEQKEFIGLPSYQAFCEYLRSHKSLSVPEITIKIHRTPGSSMEVDYSGDGVEIINPATGEIFIAQLFVGCLSYSGYFYGEFTLTQKLDDFIAAHKNMFAFFGGVASYIVPDNCKTAVIKNNGVDPIIHPTYQDMCAHYGTVVDPADPCSPRQKPNVERSVGLIQKEFFPLIRSRTLTSLVELNEIFRMWLLERLKKVTQGRGESRAFFFEQEKSSLRPLPEAPYELFYFKRAKVHPDCHFQHERNYYSVPHRFVGKEVDVKFNALEIHAYFETERIASHSILRSKYHYSTNPAHYPEKKYIDYNYHLAHVRKEASMIGTQTQTLVERLLSEEKFALKNLRKVQGILGLSKEFEKEAMEYGCEMAMKFEFMNHDRVRRFAKGYRPQQNKEFNPAPIRQLELVCLQGGQQ